MGLSVPYLVTHADFEFMGLDTETQTRLADRGAILEKCYLPVVHGDISAAEFVASIRRIGIDHCIVSTDHGAVADESPPAAYETLLETLWNEGLSEGRD